MDYKEKGMKRKVSVKMFLTVVGRGFKQAIKWFLGLFGYKRDGRYAKCVWGLFATSAAVVMTIVATVFAYEFVNEIHDKCCGPYDGCENVNFDCNQYVSKYIYFHNHEDGKGYVYDARTGEKTLKHVQWIVAPYGKDSLACYSDGKKRGYFNKFSGKVVIEPKYDHAWVFSENLACVDEGGSMKFIDPTGKVVIEPKIAYMPQTDGFVFHNGFCVVESDDGLCYGLMDKTGKMVLPKEYDEIIPCEAEELWCIRKGNRMAVIDKNMLPVLPMSQWYVEVHDDMINVTMPDHTMRKYDLQGQLINDFYVSNVDKLMYETDETINGEDTSDDGELTAYTTHHPYETARLRVYYVGDGREGLMTADGHIVTKPDFVNIEAIGYDLYLCWVTTFEKIIVNGKGETVQ